MRRPSPSRPGSSSQTWSTFLRNHARETLACDFIVVVTATFRPVYVFLYWKSAGVGFCIGMPPNIRPPSDDAAVQKRPDRR
jgi:hypothetical protein